MAFIADIDASGMWVNDLQAGVIGIETSGELLALLAAELAVHESLEGRGFSFGHEEEAFR